MLKMLAMAGLAALVTACAAPLPPSASADPMHGSRGSTPDGKSKAADLGFHGPVYRGTTPDGPN